MTDPNKADVLARWPGAVAEEEGDFLPTWTVYDGPRGTPNRACIGYGVSEAEAWWRAARDLAMRECRPFNRPHPRPRPENPMSDNQNASAGTVTLVADSPRDPAWLNCADAARWLAEGKAVERRPRIPNPGPWIDAGPGCSLSASWEYRLKPEPPQYSSQREAYGWKFPDGSHAGGVWATRDDAERAMRYASGRVVVYREVLP